MAATYVVAGQNLAEFLRLAACFTGVGAATRKAAAGLRVNGRDKLTFQDNELFFVMDVRGGIADRSAFVYGCSGLENNSLVGLVSTS